LKDWLNFFAGGFGTALISLIILIFLPDFFSKNTALFLDTFIEEFLKLSVLFFLFSQQNNTGLKNTVLSAMSFALGFSFFEFILVLLNNSQMLNYSFLNTTLIHIFTSLLLGFSAKFYRDGKKLSTIIIFLSLLAFFIHLCYNLVVGSFI